MTQPLDLLLPPGLFPPGLALPAPPRGAAPSLFDCTWKHGGSDEEIFHTISEGVPGTQMPPWKKGLPGGAEDIWKVIAYLRSASTCTVNPAPAH